MDGFVYLLHFDRPFAPGRHTAQHYLGWTPDLAARIQKHRIGRAARLTEVAHDRGIGFKVARAWPGNRRLERRLKNRKSSPRLCPICSGPRPTTYDLPELSPAAIGAELIAF